MHTNIDYKGVVTLKLHTKNGNIIRKKYNNGAPLLFNTICNFLANKFDATLSPTYMTLATKDGDTYNPLLQSNSLIQVTSVKDNTVDFMALITATQLAGVIPNDKDTYLLLLNGKTGSLSDSNILASVNLLRDLVEFAAPQQVSISWRLTFSNK